MTGVTEAGKSKWIGRRLPRKEDQRVLTAATRYLADLSFPGAWHLRLVRSTSPHARLVHIEVPDRLGDAMVFTAADLGAQPPMVRARHDPQGFRMPSRPLLATDRVRFVGEPIAAVLAPDRYLAEDAADRVRANYEAIAAVIDPLAADTGPDLHEGTLGNLMFLRTVSFGDLEGARRSAWRIVKRAFRIHRHTGVPLETRGCAAVPTGQRISLWSSTQMPHLVRSLVAETLRLEEDQVDVVAPDVGGGFGIKGHAYPEEALVAFLAMRLGHPVVWVEDRIEHMLASVHARDHVYEMELQLTKHGRILGLAAELTVDMGAYPVWPQTAALEAQMASTILPGPYVVPSYTCTARAVATNKAPLGTYRGVARPGCAFALERLMDEAAREIEMDRAEFRIRNAVSRFPHATRTGIEYDSGSVRASIKVAHSWLQEKTRHVRHTRVSDRRLIGVGLACFIEQTGHVPPWARRENGVVVGPDRVEVAVDECGEATVMIGLNSHGQGHTTTFAQVVADRLGLSPSAIEVIAGATDRTPYSTGTLASRAAVVGATTAGAAANKLRETLIGLAGDDLGAKPTQLSLADGRVSANDGSRVSLAEIVRRHGHWMKALNRRAITASSEYDGPEGGTFSNSCHAACVEIDKETGVVAILGYLVVDDCGLAINPMIVEGQIRGGVAQGIGGTLMEELVYDEYGQLLTTTLLDYSLPSMTDVPEIEIHHLETPSHNSLGVKGVGESGAIGPMAAIGNAIADAVGPGRAHLASEVPFTPPRVWAVLRGKL